MFLRGCDSSISLSYPQNQHHCYVFLRGCDSSISVSPIESSITAMCLRGCGVTAVFSVTPTESSVIAVFLRGCDSSISVSPTEFRITAMCLRGCDVTAVFLRHTHGIQHHCYVSERLWRDSSISVSHPQNPASLLCF